MLYVYEMMGVHSTYCDNHFMTYASQNVILKKKVILYILNLYSAIRQLYLKSGREMFTKTTHINFFSFLWWILSLQTIQLNYFQFFSFFRYCLKLHQLLFFLNVLTFHTFTTWTLYICIFPLSSFFLLGSNCKVWSGGDISSSCPLKLKLFYINLETSMLAIFISFLWTQFPLDCKFVIGESFSSFRPNSCF